MQTYYLILEILYFLFIIPITGFIIWNFIKTKKITDKVIGAFAILMFILRIFLIR